MGDRTLYYSNATSTCARDGALWRAPFRMDTAPQSCLTDNCQMLDADVFGFS